MSSRRGESRRGGSYGGAWSHWLGVRGLLQPLDLLCNRLSQSPLSVTTEDLTSVGGGVTWVSGRVESPALSFFLRHSDQDLNGSENVGKLVLGRKEIRILRDPRRREVRGRVVLRSCGRRHGWTGCFGEETSRVYVSLGIIEPIRRKSRSFSESLQDLNV